MEQNREKLIANVMNLWNQLTKDEKIDMLQVAEELVARRGTV